MSSVGHKPVVRALLSGLRSAIFGIGGILFLVALLVLGNAGTLKAIYHRLFGSSGEAVQDDLTHVVQLDTAKSAHMRIGTAFSRMWQQALNADTIPNLWVVEGDGINAASMGRHVFLFWEGISDLSDWALDGVIAHEIAHDILLHVKKAEELSDLLNFFGEVIGLFVGADHSSESTIKEWMNLGALPPYSKSQELAADARAVSLLSQIGYKNAGQTLAETLGILVELYGDTGGGFFDHHPSTSDRIAMLAGEP